MQGVLMKCSQLYRLSLDYIRTCHPWMTRGLGSQVLVKPLAQRSDHTSKVKIKYVIKMKLFEGIE
jgi:hypothetical protein